MSKRSVVLSAIILLAFCLAFSESVGVNGGELCERLSQTYSGLVCHNHLCDNRCIGWEKAVHGACHLRNWILGCYCYYEDCTKAPPPPPGSPPPPPASPPPLGSPGSGKGDDSGKGTPSGGNGKGTGGGAGGGANPCN